MGELLKLVSNNAVQVWVVKETSRGFIHQGKPCKEHGDAFCAKISRPNSTHSKGIGRPAQRRLQRVAASLLSSTTGSRAAGVCRPPAHRPISSITGAGHIETGSRTQGPESAFSS